MRKIYILGAKGFIGSRLVEKFSKNTAENVIGYSSKECNLLSMNSITDAFSLVTEDDIIIMASSITRLFENSFSSMIQNINMAENLCCFLENHFVSQLIFFSSVDVYGLLPDDILISEKILPNPNDYYAISKITSEYLLKKTLYQQGIPLTIFRLSGIYGPGDEGKSTINTLINAAKSKGKILIYGDGSNKRDFVYVDDIFKIILEAIRHKTDTTVNVATGRSYSVKEIAKKIIAAMGGACVLEYKKTPQTSEKRIKHMNYDITKLHNLFPNMAFTSIEDGIAQYVSL